MLVDQLLLVMAVLMDTAARRWGEEKQGAPDTAVLLPSLVETNNCNNRYIYVESNKERQRRFEVNEPLLAKSFKPLGDTE